MGSCRRALRIHDSNLESDQKEDLSRSGMTRVAFTCRAIATMSHICNGTDAADQEEIWKRDLETSIHTETCLTTTACVVERVFQQTFSRKEGRECTEKTLVLMP